MKGFFVVENLFMLGAVWEKAYHKAANRVKGWVVGDWWDQTVISFFFIFKYSDFVINYFHFQGTIFLNYHASTRSHVFPLGSSDKPLTKLLKKKFDFSL